jgi:hypothetical protein
MKKLDIGYLFIMLGAVLACYVFIELIHLYEVIKEVWILKMMAAFLLSYVLIGGGVVIKICDKYVE